MTRSRIAIVGSVVLAAGLTVAAISVAFWPDGNAPAGIQDSGSELFFSSVVQNAGVPQGGPNGLNDIEHGCVPTRTAWDTVHGGGMNVGDTLASTEFGEVRVTSIEEDGYRRMFLTMDGTSTEAFSYAQPVDSCENVLITMNVLEGSAVDFHFVSPSGVDYSALTAHRLGAELVVEPGFVAMTIPGPEAGDWMVEASPEVAAPGDVTIEVLIQQDLPVTAPWAVCEATVTGSSLTVDASKSWDDDGEIVKIQWGTSERTFEIGPTHTWDMAGTPPGEYLYDCTLTDNDGQQTVGSVYVKIGAQPTSSPEPSPRSFSSVEFTGGPGGGAMYPWADRPEGCEETRTAWTAFEDRDVPYGTVLASSDMGVVTEGNIGEDGAINMLVEFSGRGSTPIVLTEQLDSCRPFVTWISDASSNADVYTLTSPSGETYDGADLTIDEPEPGTWTLTFHPGPSTPARTTIQVLFSQEMPTFYAPSSICTVSVTGRELQADASESWDEDGHIVDVQWAFPGDATATGVTATHMLPSGTRGPHWIDCRLTDDEGHVTTDWVKIEIW